MTAVSTLRDDLTFECEFKDRHGGFERDSWYLHVNVYP